MKKETLRTIIRIKILCGALAAVLVLSSLSPGVRSAMGDTDYTTILGFEQANPVYQESVSIGTAWEQLGLPAELRAVCEMAGNNASDNNEDISEDAKVHEDNSNVGEVVNDSGEGGFGAGVVLNIPVTWEGAYDGNTPGTYNLVARVENYNYSGEMPFAIITVVPEEMEAVRAAVPGAMGDCSISGFLWVDGNGSLSTDWDGLYNGEEQPLAGYTVYLYAAEDLKQAIFETQTAADGTYAFMELMPGDYILGLESQIISGIEYLLPLKITAENKFAANWESEPLMAYTQTIKLAGGQVVENINAGMRLPIMVMALADYTIDLAKLVNGNSGQGWSYAGGATANVGDGTITFYGNHATHGSASNNKYSIIRSAQAYSRRDIIINSDVNNITIRYDGPNILVNGFPNNSSNPDYYYPFISNITVKGGAGNSVVYDKVYNLQNSVLTIDSGAANTTVTYNEVSHRIHSSDKDAYNLIYTLTNNGANTTVIYKGVSIKRATFNHNKADKATMFLRGVNSFKSFENKLSANSSLNLLLSGSSIAESGFIDTPETAKLTIDSESSTPAAPGSEAGSLSLALSSSNAACIGSSSGQSGQITINGGTLTVAQTKGTGSSNGAAIGGAQSGAGNVTIIGGKVIAKAINGAAIGGGNGSNGTGNVTITGGTVNATVTDYGSGAAIGGGAGGAGNVIIEGGTITANATGIGAAIGGGSHSGSGEKIGFGKVLIKGGVINAESSGGAAIGGGGTTDANSGIGICDVTIYDGDLTLASIYGACIGNGGSANNGVPGSGIGGSVVIYGGKIYALSGDGNLYGGDGIGTGQNSSIVPRIQIEPQADIIAFGKTISNFPGIDCGDGTPTYDNGVNKGAGYFVNMNFETKIGAADGLVVIYNTKSPLVPVRIAKIPFAFRLLSFTTGADKPENFYVYTGTFSGGLQQIIRATDNNPNIYSVKRPWDYKDNKHVSGQYFRSLSVKYGPLASFPLYFAVTEKHVDMSGQPIAGVEDGLELVEGGKNYSKLIPGIPGYSIKGYKLSSNGALIEKTTASISNITASTQIYFVYDLLPTVVDVTVSKKVSGSFADMSKTFAFTVYLKDEKKNPLSAGKKFTYVLSDQGASTPKTGVLTLAAGGTAEFSLMHGQTITIKNVPVDAWIKIAEDKYNNYDTSYKKKGDISSTKGYETELIIVGFEDQTFEFFNERKAVAPTGIEEAWGREALLLFAMLIIASGLTATYLIKRRSCTSGYKV